ncbi:hypothetical protein F5141DRAFT_1063146 [Pisolithus sp. B1]|nr:hypothetical protein F5141DRAFT_1063146 [Pisolithus sp. B1]
MAANNNIPAIVTTDLSSRVSLERPMDPPGAANDPPDSRPLVVDAPAHRRKGSFATFTSSHEGRSSLDGTEPDHGGNDYPLLALRRPKSDATSLTVASPAYFDTASEHFWLHSHSGKHLTSSHWSDGNVAEAGRNEGDVIESAGLEDEPVDTDPKNLDAFEAMGETDALLKGLGTHPTCGLLIGIPDYGGGGPPGAGSGASQRHDRHVPMNQDAVELSAPPAPLHPPASDRLKTVRDFGTPRTPGDPPVDWVEGVAIMIAILIVVIVGSLNDWQKERQFKVLNEKKEERGTKVNFWNLARYVMCDESAATGETDAIKKAPYSRCLASKEARSLQIANEPIGSKVLEGVGCYVVVAVGTKSFNGCSMMGIVFLSSFMIRFFVQLGTGNPQRDANQNGMAFVQILIISVTLVVPAVPEGSQEACSGARIPYASCSKICLPLAVTLALAFATKRMSKENLLVRVLGSCGTMANASVICTDETGSIGVHAKFVHRLEQNQSRTNAEDGSRNSHDSMSNVGHKRDFSIDQSHLNAVLSPQLRKLFNVAVAVNFAAFEDKEWDSETTVFVGSKTEMGMLSFAKELGRENYREVRQNANMIQMFPFSSERKVMDVVVRLGGGSYRLYVKGASEILTKLGTYHVVVSQDGAQAGNEGEETAVAQINEWQQENISHTIICYANT